MNLLDVANLVDVARETKGKPYAWCAFCGRAWADTEHTKDCPLVPVLYRLRHKVTYAADWAPLRATLMRLVRLCHTSDYDYGNDNCMIRSQCNRCKVFRKHDTDFRYCAHRGGCYVGAVERWVNPRTYARRGSP